MNSATTHHQQYRGINRTICIGLGGTGRDVLMRIRRLIVDRYGDLTNLPIISFLVLSTLTLTKPPLKSLVFAQVVFIMVLT